VTEEQVFLAALDLPDADARAAYLDATCGGDAAFRRRVETLLAAHFKSGEFLDVPVAEQVQAGSREDNTATIDRAAVPAANDREDEADDLHFLTPSTRPDSLGRLGHYEVLQVLGKGGFGIVFRAFDDTLQRVVAVKVMAPLLAATSPARRRFLREARSSAAVRHENVVQVYEVGEQPLPYLVVEFIPGETLQQKLDRTGPLDVSEVLRIGRQIAEGLAAAHASDLIHRDIKPGNILLEGGSQKVKITDFGLARAADDASISQSGVVAGTPMFMAPEQALGGPIDQRADLFSLGSVLYQMVSGRPPFRAPSVLGVLKRVAEEPPRPIPEIIPETPAWLCGIIAKLHAKNPADRFQSAREVADLLADCEAKFKAKQAVKNVLPVAVKPAGRKWVTVAVVLCLAVIALAVTEFAGVTHLFRVRQATPDPTRPGGDPTPIQGAKKEAPTTAAEQLARRALLDKQPWRSLFNRQNLTGWTTAPDCNGDWEVEDGILVGRGGVSYLYTVAEHYRDVHLRVEAKINATGDSGVFVRVPARRLHRAFTGYEAQILLEGRDTTGMIRSVRTTTEDLVTPDTWFTLEVIAVGHQLISKVNGRTVADTEDPTGLYSTGRIALQSASPETVVQFRKIEVKDLP